MERKAVKKTIDADAEAFGRLVDGKDEYRSALKSAGRARLLAIYKAGIKRGKSLAGRKDGK